jgi:hypothetical protein
MPLGNFYRTSFFVERKIYLNVFELIGLFLHFDMVLPFGKIASKVDLFSLVDPTELNVYAVALILVVRMGVQFIGRTVTQGLLLDC